MSSQTFPPIPEARADIESLRQSVVALTLAVETLAGYRGARTDAAVTRADLVTLGLATEVQLNKIL